MKTVVAASLNACSRSRRVAKPTKRVFDDFGALEVLFTHVGVVNKAGARTQWHDGVKNAIFHTTRLAGIPVEDETLIRVLGDGIPDDAQRQRVVDAIVAAQTRAEEQARKHKLGVIPDLLLGPEKRLVDVIRGLVLVRPSPRD